MHNQREYLGNKTLTIEIHRARNGGVSAIMLESEPIIARNVQNHRFVYGGTTYYVSIWGGKCDRVYAQRWVDAFRDNGLVCHRIDLRDYTVVIPKRCKAKR